ncbi:MAG: diguanylate cyclase [Coprococcus sp.]|nr:diguanylate cyclase [Coprococcus sp.]
MEKILIVDDSAMQAATLKSILDEDYEIVVAQTAEESLNYINVEEFSLILLDVVMPGMDGFMLLKRLQEEIITRNVPVILITSLSDIEHEKKGFMLGAVDYITKPFHPAIVQARVNTHIKLYRYRKQVEQQSMTDQLTGIANRRQYELYSLAKWEEVVRLKIPFSVCMFDIDNFKVYNDTFGHPAGDKVITTVAEVLSKSLRRATDFVARYGGEEFVAIIVGDEAKKAFDYVKQIGHELEGLHIPHNPSVRKWVTMSCGGVTVIPKNTDQYHTYLKLADTMLYDAKRYGRNRVIWFGDDMKQWV